MFIADAYDCKLSLRAGNLIYRSYPSFQPDRFLAHSIRIWNLLSNSIKKVSFNFSYNLGIVFQPSWVPDIPDRKCKCCSKNARLHADCVNCNLDLCEFCGINCANCDEPLCTNCITLL